MAEGDLKPYRLEWRPSYSARWTRIEDLDEHPGDLKKYVESQSGWGEWIGCWRLVSQHVIQEAGF